MKNVAKMVLILFSIIVFCFGAVACGKKTNQTNSDSDSESNSTVSVSVSSSKENTSNSDSAQVSHSKSNSNVQTDSNSFSKSPINSNSDSSKKSNSQSSTDTKPSDGEEKKNDSEKYIKALNSNSQFPCIVSTIFNTSETVIASVVATSENGYAVDKTGKTDSTNGIKKAIADVSALGGGTVFLPSGDYLVTSTITIPEYVTLRGDWQNPTSASELTYGTVILAKPSELTASQKPQDNPLFSMRNNSGIYGLTVFYPQQSESNIKNYGYTIYANEPTKLTVKNLTLINSLYGIGVSLNSNYNELVTIENLFGTCLKNAIAHNGLTDVGYYHNINISPEFWINANSRFKCAEAEKLTTYLKSNLEALILGDLDDQLLSKIYLSTCKTAIKFVGGIRENSGFWGLCNDVQITNSSVGVLAEALNSRSGAVFTSSSVQKIVNNATAGVIKLCDTEKTDISGTGKTVVEKGTIDLSSYAIEDKSNFLKTEKLYLANLPTSGDVAADLQSALNLAASSGGIVVVPNGIYTIKTAINIPKNVQLSSTLSVFGRTSQAQTNKNGVVFASYCKGATFTLAENAGIANVRIWHVNLSPSVALDALKNSNSSAYNVTSIKGTASNCFAYNVESVGANVAFDFQNCDNHILKCCYGLAYSNFIVAGGTNGKIIGCLSNPNFITRSNLYNYFDSQFKADWQSFVGSESNDKFMLIREDLGRTYTTMIKLTTSNGEQILNTFCYGEAGLVEFNDAKNALLINTSLDFIPSTKAVYTMNSGSATIVGSLRVYGYSINLVGGKIEAYGRIAFGEINESAYNSSINKNDEITYVSDSAKRQTLFDCDSVPTNVQGVTLNTKNSFKLFGNGSWAHLNGASGNVCSSSFNTVDASSFKFGYLHMSVFVSDISKMNEGQIEITSSGTCDKNELNWSLSSALTNSGWNDVWLDIYAGGVTGGQIDLAKVNYLRIYSVNSTCDFYLDQIEFVTD